MPGSVHYHCVYMLQVSPSLTAASLLVRRGGVIKLLIMKVMIMAIT